MTLHPPSPSTFRDFRRMFPDEAACIDYLARWRWADGFRCPRCGGDTADRLHCRPLCECRACRHQTSVTAGTALHRSHLRLHARAGARRSEGGVRGASVLLIRRLQSSFAL
jgi:hypothetical protein